jgi:translation initiation factor IF-2
MRLSMRALTEKPEGYVEPKRGERGPRRDGDRGSRRDGDRGPRRDGDRGERREGDRGPRRDGDRGPRRDGERREGGERRNDDRHNAPRKPRFEESAPEQHNEPDVF